MALIGKAVSMLRKQSEEEPIPLKIQIKVSSALSRKRVGETARA